MKIRSYGGTDPGKIRSNNEDSFLADDALRLYAVADGIGGSEGGEIASRIVVETLAGEMPQMQGGAAKNDDQAVSALRTAITLSNKKIREAQIKTPSLAGMGTTLSLFQLEKARTLTANVGDSRVYRLRSNKLKQLTQDHSLIAEYVNAGLLNEEEAKQSPYRHVITRAVGIEDSVLPEFMEDDLRRGDRFLACTDGLTEMLEHAEIKEIMGEASSPREAVKTLIAAANDHGGVDNITAIVVWIDEL